MRVFFGGGGTHPDFGREAPNQRLAPVKGAQAALLLVVLNNLVGAAREGDELHDPLQELA